MPSAEPDTQRFVSNLSVRFAAAGGRSGPLTMGQTNMLLCILREDDASLMNVHEIWDVPAGLGVERICALLRVLHERHESLRTRYHFVDRVLDETDEEPVQEVAAGGEVTVAVHDVPAPADPAGYARELARQMQSTDFDLAAEWPLRVAVVLAAGTPTHVVLAISHMAMDAATIVLLRREWQELVHGRKLPPPAAVRPVDLAEYERTPEGLRGAAAAVRHWETQLLNGPQAMFAAPGVGATDWRQPRLRIRSRAAAEALGRIAERTGASRSTIVLAALCAAVGWRVGQRRCLVATLSSNRYQPGLRDYFGTIAQDALLSVDVDAATFDGLVRRAHRRASIAYPNSRFDARVIWATIDRTGWVRGTHFARDLVFNDMSALDPDPAPLGPPEPGAVPVEVTWLPVAPLRARLALWVHRLVDEIDLVLWADTQCLSREDSRAVGTGIGDLLIAAADRDVDIAEVRAVFGVAPVSRGADWLLVDSCWIDRAAVDRLMADVLGNRPFLVVPEPDPDLGHRLVCYVGLDDRQFDPEAVHDTCVGLLTDRPTVMAPHRYVGCDGAPADTADAPAWRRMPVRVEGTGRAAALRS